MRSSTPLPAATRTRSPPDTRGACHAVPDASVPCPAVCPGSVSDRCHAHRDTRRPRDRRSRRDPSLDLEDERHQTRRGAGGGRGRDRRPGSDPRDRPPRHRPVRGGSTTGRDDRRRVGPGAAPRSRRSETPRPVRRRVPGYRPSSRAAASSSRGAHPHPRRERESGRRAPPRTHRRPPTRTRHEIPGGDLHARGRLRRRARRRSRWRLAHRAAANPGASVADVTGRTAPLHPRALGRDARRRPRFVDRPPGCRHRGPGRRGARDAPSLRRDRRRPDRDAVVPRDGRRARGVLVGLGVDASARPDGQEHLCLARPVVAHVRPGHPHARRDPRRRARHHRVMGRDRALADRSLGAVQGVRADQAHARQRRRGGLGLLARRLPDRGRHRWRSGLRGPARPGLGTRHPPRERHGPQPHGHRFELGHRAPGVVPVAVGAAIPRVHLHRRRSLLG